jgi:hypothetical protein
MTSSTETHIDVGQKWRSRVGGAEIEITAVLPDGRFDATYPLAGRTVVLSGQTIRDLYTEVPRLRHLRLVDTQESDAIERP